MGSIQGVKPICDMDIVTYIVEYIKNLIGSPTLCEKLGDSYIDYRRAAENQVFKNIRSKRKN